MKNKIRTLFDNYSTGLNLELESEGMLSVDEFNRQITKELYSNLPNLSAKRFITKVHKYITVLNYERITGSDSAAPPYQRLCRRQEGYCKEGILDFTPIILGKPVKTKSKPAGEKKRAWLKPMFKVRSLFSNKKKTYISDISTNADHPINRRNVATVKQANAKSIDYEFVDFKNIDWRHTRMNQLNRESGTDLRYRNRRDIMNQARLMLAQKVGDSKLKDTLPITEGELAMVKQGLTLQKEARIES
jgi:hypothetical protein